VLAGAEGEIRYRALAGEVNLVLGLEPGTPAHTRDVEVDGMLQDHHHRPARSLQSVERSLRRTRRGAAGSRPRAWPPTPSPSVSNRGVREQLSSFSRLDGFARCSSKPASRARLQVIGLGVAAQGHQEHVFQGGQLGRRARPRSRPCRAGDIARTISGLKVRARWSPSAGPL